MIGSLVLFETEFLNIVSISFTSLVLNELIMVAVEVTTWHTLMILSEVITLGLYVVSILFLPEYFGEFRGSPTSAIWKAAERLNLFATRRLVVRVVNHVRLEGRADRRHFCFTAVVHQVAQRSICANSVRQTARFLKAEGKGASRFSLEVGEVVRKSLVAR